MTPEQTPDTPTAATPTAETPAAMTPMKSFRAALAGVLMGIANLIPGVSGGTMILAVGLYEEFIDSIADITALRLRLGRIIFLAIVILCAGAAIFGLAGVILYLLFWYPTAMFALFIGLTLGGAPLLAAQLRPLRPDVVVATLVGLALMVGILFLRQFVGGFPHNTAMDFVSGIVGATTMVLPGISGSYMLLVLEQYDRVVGAVDSMKDGLRGDSDLLKQALWIVIPVGIGAVLGVVVLSNLLKYLLHHYHRATVGVLLGILLGSVIGLWPFGRAPGDKALERQEMGALITFAQTWQVPAIADLELPDDDEAAHAEVVAAILQNWNSRQAPDYTPGRISAALAMVIAGFVATFLLSRLRGSETPPPTADGANRLESA